LGNKACDFDLLLGAIPRIYTSRQISSRSPYKISKLAGRDIQVALHPSFSCWTCAYASILFRLKI